MRKISNADWIFIYFGYARSRLDAPCEIADDRLAPLDTITEIEMSYTIQIQVFEHSISIDC